MTLKRISSPVRKIIDSASKLNPNKDLLLLIAVLIFVPAFIFVFVQSFKFHPFQAKNRQVSNSPQAVYMRELADAYLSGRPVAMAAPTAGMAKSVYEVCKRPDEDLSNRPFVVSTITCGLFLDTAVKVLCEPPSGQIGSIDKETIWAEGRADQCVPPFSSQDTVSTGGLLALTARSLDLIHTGDNLIPTDMALFINDTLGDTILGSPIYAQSSLSKPSDFFRQITFNIWKISRNIALALLVLFLTVVGLSIMFRQKISPQATVTLASSLPYLPISLAGILLSYPIVTVVYNSLWPLHGIAFKIGTNIIGELGAGASFWGAVGGVITAGGLSVYGIIAFVITFLISGAWVGLVVAALPLIIMLIVMVVMLLIMFCAYIYQLVKTYMVFIFLVIAFPLVMAMAILPGKQYLIGYLFKKLISNMLAIPIMTLFMLIGIGFIVTIADPGMTPFSGPAGLANYVFQSGIIGGLFKFFLGIGIMWQGLKARSILEEALGAGGSVFSMMQGGGQQQRR